MYPPIALSRTPAADDTDGATRQTVQKMCELIRESAADPLVQQCAAYAKKHFACGNSDPAWLAWGVFWYVKHCVKFRNDEATMFRVGEANQQDLLIAPAVLVRMKDPSEDCDGFTMLTAAMLTVLGVPVVIATVAVDLDDPSRWSHVFLCAIINGRVKPLDTSHGIGPGWMVPRSRINRWQTWTLDGKPAHIPIPAYQGLNGYVSRSGIGGIGYGRPGVPPGVVMLANRARRGFRGLGQAGCWCDDGSDGSSGICDDGTAATCGTPTGSGEGGPEGNSLPTGTTSTEDPTNVISSAEYCDVGWTLTGPGVCSQAVGGATKAASATPNYAAVVSSLANAAGQDIKAVIQQPQALLNAQTWANLSAYLPILGIGFLGVWALTSVIGSKK
jgi:hypothetical protein